MKKNIIIFIIITVIFIICIATFLLKNNKSEQQWVPNNSVNFINDTNLVEKTQPVIENNSEPYGNISHIPSNNTVTYSDADLKAENAYFDENGVIIEVLEDTISKTGCKLKITNTGGDPGQWSDCFWLEKKENGVWKDVSFIPSMSYKNGYSGSILYYYNMSLNWTEIYGSLENGTYRAYITQNFSSYQSPEKPKGYYSNEFEIK